MSPMADTTGEPQPLSRRRRWPLVAAVTVLAVVVGGGTYAYLGADPTSTFCYSSGFILPSGELAGSGPDCRRLNEDGSLVTTFNDGTPLCYTVEASSSAVGHVEVPCDDPRAAERPDGSPL
jgi:hypothetical protein